MKRRRKAQSILEYTLLLGAIIAVIVLVLLNNETGIKSKVETLYNSAGTSVNNVGAAMNQGIFNME